MGGHAYINCEPLQVMEDQTNSRFDIIYLDVPYFSENKFEYDGGAVSARHYLAVQKGCSIGEITLNEVKAEQERTKQVELKAYADYISHVVENSFRLLSSDGTLVFLAPGKECVDINYRLILDQFFPASINVTLETPVKPFGICPNNNYVLYFYSKEKNHTFPVLKELRDISEFKEKDEIDYYLRISLFSHYERVKLRFNWHNILPPKGKSWRYSKDRLDELWEENKIIIENGKAYIKAYRNENPIVVSSVWKCERPSFCGALPDEKSYERIFNMFGKYGSVVFCPFERAGAFSLLAHRYGYEWVSVLADDRLKNSCFMQIDETCYEKIYSVTQGTSISYRSGIVTNASDIGELQKKMLVLDKSLKKIQLSIGIEDNDDASIDQVVEKIHRLYLDTLTPVSIENTIPEAQEWIAPYWDKLEKESKQFISMGLLLYNQLINNPDMDMAPSMIEFCRALEGELFSKMFYGYTTNLIKRNINVRVAFPEAFDENSTEIFAKFLETCITTNRSDTSAWKFELGKMAYVLNMVLSKKPRKPIIQDFRAYLNSVFDGNFFGSQFAKHLFVITNLRNSCAHPSIINSASVEDGKKLIREKLLIILQYYNS